MQSNASPASNQGAPTSPFAQTTAPGTNGAAKPKMEAETDSETAIKSKQELLQTASKHLYEGLKALIEATAMETQEVSKTISESTEVKPEPKAFEGNAVQEPVKAAPESVKVEPSPQPQSPSILPFAPVTPKAEETEKPAGAENAATASPFTASFSGKTEEKPFVPPSALIPANPPAEKPEAAAPTMPIPPFSMATPTPEAPAEAPAAPASSSPFAPVKKAEDQAPAESPAAPASPFAPVQKAEEAAPASEATASIPQLPVFGAPTTPPQAPATPAAEETPGAFPQLPPSPFTISAGASQPPAETQEPAEKPASTSPFTAPTSMPAGASPFAPVMPTPGEENNSAPANPENSPFKAPAASPFQETLPPSGDSKS